MTARVPLGIVDGNGVVRFADHDINECRWFLRRSGLECTNRGWLGHGKGGAIYYTPEQGGWEAAYWLN